MSSSSSQTTIAAAIGGAKKDKCVIWPSYHHSSILSLDCSESSGVVVSGAESSDVCIWDAHNRALIHQLSGFPGEVTAVAFYKNVLFAFSEHDSCVSSIQFSPNTNELFSAGTD